MKNEGKKEESQMRYSRLFMVLLMVTLAPLFSLPAHAGEVGAWTAAAPMAVHHHDCASAVLPDGRVMVVGGSFDANIEIFDPASNTWSTAASPATLRYYGHTVTVLTNGKVLVTGGAGDGWTFSAADLYDPASNSWSSAAEMSTPRERHAATLLPSGKVLVTGGTFRSEPLASAEVYDPVTNSWTPADTMMTPRAFHTSTMLPGGKVLVAGDLYNPSSELYDPATNTWSMAAPMGVPRSWHSANLLKDGKVLVLGGISTSGIDGIIASAELYDPATNSWSAAASMPIQLMWHTSTLLKNGKVLLAGGMYQMDSYLPDASLYDPSTNTWSATASMSTRRGRPIAAALLDGSVLVAGGGNNDEFLSSAEIFRLVEATYSFAGFFTPVDNPPALNTAKAGETIPLKWKLHDSTGQPVQDNASFVSVTSYPVTCSDFSGSAAQAVAEPAAGGSGLQYLGNGNYQYNWKTSKSYAEQCRVIQLKLKDGTSHEARFNFVQ